MFSSISRDNAYVKLKSDFIRAEYRIDPTSIVPAKRGYFGETWMMKTSGGNYFLKLDYSALHRNIYENSFHVIQRLNDSGIDFISKIVKTAQGTLCAHFDSAVMGVFEWIGGENIQDEHTKIQEYKMLSRVYTIPPGGLSIRQEDFSTGSLELFLSQCERLENMKNSETAERILALLKRYESVITHRADRLRLFSEICAPDTSRFYITHGDAGGNVITDGGKFYLVDWDSPVLAPPERDAWFCLHWDWAMKAFNGALRQSGIDYAVRPERLAYYCYHSFFWYMTEYLGTYLEIGDRGGDMCARISGYLTGWIEEELRYADTMRF
jgi:Ser/Thr protein kinase RdoA (MazF antagonist)